MGLPNKRPGKSQKGTVSIAEYKNGLRLRWRYDGTRPALYVSSSVANYQRIAHVVKGMIERDILIDNYDVSLLRYQEILQKAAIHDATLEQQILSLGYVTQPKVNSTPDLPLDIIDLFDHYLAVKGKTEHNLPTYYY
jgi:hypothetical protein